MHVAEVELKLGTFLTEALHGLRTTTVRTGRFNQRTTACSKAMHCKRVSVGQTASLDAVVKGTVPVPNGNRMSVLFLASTSFTNIKKYSRSFQLSYGETEC